MEPMSAGTRDFLIEHIDGPVSLTAGVTVNSYTEKRDQRQRAQLIVKCLRLRWIELNSQVNPTKTSLTDAGREILGKLLGEWADILCRAGAQFKFTPDFIEDARDQPKEPT